MSFHRFVRLGACAIALGAAAISAEAQTPAPEPRDAVAFQCDDGGKLYLTFAETGAGVAAMVWVRGVAYRLPYLPPEPGPVQIVWSDGEHSLTWSPGVRLMWMASATHLMCGRGGHTH